MTEVAEHEKFLSPNIFLSMGQGGIYEPRFVSGTQEQVSVRLSGVVLSMGESDGAVLRFQFRRAQIAPWFASRRGLSFRLTGAQIRNRSALRAD